MNISKTRDIASQQTGDVASALEFLLRLVESQDLQLHGCSKGIAEHKGMTLAELLTYYSENSINWNDVFLDVRVSKDLQGGLMNDCSFQIASVNIELEEAAPEDCSSTKYLPCPVPDNIIEYIKLARKNAESCNCTLDMTLSDANLLAFNIPNQEEGEKFIIVLQLAA